MFVSGNSLEKDMEHFLKYVGVEGSPSRLTRPFWQHAVTTLRQWVSEWVSEWVSGGLTPCRQLRPSSRREHEQKNKKKQKTGKSNSWKTHKRLYSNEAMFRSFMPEDNTVKVRISSSSSSSSYSYSSSSLLLPSLLIPSSSPLLHCNFSWLSQIVPCHMSKCLIT